MTGLNLSQLKRAITSGTEGGIFLLPKGPSGKVKLASPSTSASKEVSLFHF
jgi:histone H1/5